MTLPAARGELRLAGVTLLSVGANGYSSAGIALVIDASGVGLAHPSWGPRRVLPWSAVTEWAVEPRVGDRPDPPGTYGATLRFSTADATYRIVVPGVMTADLAPRLDAIAEAHVTRPAHAPAPPSSRPRRSRLRIAATVVAVAVVATAVALVLAQSAGAIHLQILGGGPPTEHVPSAELSRW